MSTSKTSSSTKALNLLEWQGSKYWQETVASPEGMITKHPQNRLQRVYLLEIRVVWVGNVEHIVKSMLVFVVF